MYPNISELVHYCNISVPGCAKMSPHQIPYYDLTFVISGEMTYDIAGKSYRLQSGDALFLPPNTRRSRETGTTAVHYVSFNFSTYEPLPPTDVYLPGVIGGEIVQLICAYPYHHLSHLQHAKEKCIHVLSYILLELDNCRQLLSQNRYIRQVQRYVSQNLRNPITLSTAAGEVNLSKQYLANLFRRELGMCFTDYLHEQRLQLARELILHTDMPLSDIAGYVGFPDYNYFSRLFSKRFCITAVKLKTTARNP